ncbi:ABC transporter permease [Halanaerobaculum tunisiense]
MRRSLFNLVLSSLSLLLLLFILAPLIKLTTGSSVELVLSTLQEKEVYQSILLTFRASLTATVITLLLGVPLAYLLARVNFPGRSLIEGIINLPVIIPHTAAGIALLTVFGNRFIGGKLFGFLGIEFVGKFAGIVVAMMFVSLPFLVNEVKEGFRAIDVRLEKVARTLGATPAQVFFKVALPLNLNHIVSGSMMMWARGLSEFGAVMILAYHPRTAPVLIYERFTSYGLKYSRPVAIVMVLTTLVVFICLRLLQSRGAK